MIDRWNNTKKAKKIERELNFSPGKKKMKIKI